MQQSHSTCNNEYEQCCGHIQTTVESSQLLSDVIMARYQVQSVNTLSTHSSLVDKDQD